MNITLEDLVKTKSSLDSGERLSSIIKTNNIEATPKELSEALIKKYGTDTVGNPLKRSVITRRADRAVNDALLELPKLEVITYLENKIKEIQA